MSDTRKRLESHLGDELAFKAIEKYKGASFDSDSPYRDHDPLMVLLSYMDGAKREYESIRTKLGNNPSYDLSEANKLFLITENINFLEAKNSSPVVRFVALVYVLVSVDLLMKVLMNRPSLAEDIECEADNLIDIIRECYVDGGIYHKAVRDVFWLKEECFKLLQRTR